MTAPQANDTPRANGSPPAKGAERLFTVEEANLMMPLVRAIVSDLSRLSHDVVERRQRVALLRSGRESGARNPESRDPYSEELAQIEDELEKQTRELQGYVDELRALGIEPKDGLAGIIDFPAVMDGRRVCLCWQLGEPEVLFWHEVDSGFAGRQPLVAGSLSADGNGLDGSHDQDSPATD
ncbi:MAG: DUF2203 domain-containing protein [Pirellulales bacterium]|nr:DUF2203 domain-containing protein [Pirellulales bacterium]